MRNKDGALPEHAVGNVGLYYVCSRLSCLGWNVMPTARNARGVDSLIYSQDASLDFHGRELTWRGAQGARYCRSVGPGTSPSSSFRASSRAPDRLESP